MKVLIVEDDPMSRLLLEATVRQLGHDCLTAENGLQAWQIFQQTPADVVISDWLMPGLNGIELCRNVRLRADSTPVYTYFIVTTMLSSHEQFLEAMAVGADDFLTKPIDRVELQARLRVAARITTLSHQVQELAAQEERARLARDLHDSVTQMLFSGSLIAEVLPQVWDRDQATAREYLADLRLLTRGALAEMRALLLELRPAALVEAEFTELLGQLVEATRGRERVPVMLRVEGSPCLPPDVQIALYRIAQEALNNAAKHARARAVDIQLCANHDTLILRIHDDGIGFDQERVGPGHLGLAILHERAAAIGAALHVVSGPDYGTSIEVIWPKATTV